MEKASKFFGTEAFPAITTGKSVGYQNFDYSEFYGSDFVLITRGCLDGFPL